jgi:tRNA-Thr(GGU) m(6)t(6)A37 methyltransferase TsaA
MSFFKEEGWNRSKMNKLTVDLKFIGVVKSPYKQTWDMPLLCNEMLSEIKIFEEYVQGLKDLSGFSHLHIYFWLHKSEGYSIVVKTPWDVIPHGLFSTRSSHRPNPIGHTIIELIERKDNILKVKGLDAIDDTPVIDIKPYVKRSDFKPNAVSGWLENTELNEN